MKKTVLRLAVALFVSFMMVTGFAPQETYAVSGKCIATGCNSSCLKASWYCYKHECKKSGCDNKATNQGYCSTHASKSYSSSYKSTSSSSKSNSKKSTSSKSSYSKSKSNFKKSYYDMPDCDDYEDYDDFMDDWDGCMPDDLDAEDYWDNW